jgi:hypothetical protein
LKVFIEVKHLFSKYKRKLSKIYIVRDKDIEVGKDIEKYKNLAGSKTFFKDSRKTFFFVFVHVCAFCLLGGELTLKK